MNPLNYIHGTAHGSKHFLASLFFERAMTEFQKPKTLELQSAVTLSLHQTIIASLDHFFHVLQRLISPFLSHWISFYNMKPRNFLFCSVWTWGFSSFQDMFSSILPCSSILPIFSLECPVEVLCSSSGFLLKNNYKTQSILLVKQRFKHIWFLIIRVLCTWFCPVNLHLEIECLTLDFHTHLEIEFLTLDFLRAKSSPLDSIC